MSPQLRKQKKSNRSLLKHLSLVFFLLPHPEYSKNRAFPQIFLREDGLMIECLNMEKDLNKKVAQFALSFTRWVGSPASIIAHSCFFLVCLILPLFGFSFDRILLFLTTIVSLEAIYLAILIQLTINRNTENLEKVEQNLGEIKIDMDEIQEDVDEIQEDVGEIQEDVDEIQKDVDEIQEDVDEIQKDVDEIEEGEQSEEQRDTETKEMIVRIEDALKSLVSDIEKLKQENTKKIKPKTKSLKK